MSTALFDELDLVLIKATNTLDIIAFDDVQ